MFNRDKSVNLYKILHTLANFKFTIMIMSTINWNMNYHIKLSTQICIEKWALPFFKLQMENWLRGFLRLCLLPAGHSKHLEVWICRSTFYKQRKEYKDNKKQIKCRLLIWMFNFQLHFFCIQKEIYVCWSIPHLFWMSYF